MSRKRVTRKKNWLQDNFEALLFAFVVAMIIRNYTFQNFKIPSSSMVPTLKIGDYLVANKVKYYFTDPERGDIVTFRYPVDTVEPEPKSDHIQLIKPIYWDKNKNFFEYHSRRNVVKRVIGMPGDTIEVINKKVLINNEKFDDPYGRNIDPRVFPRNFSGLVIEGKSFWEKNMGSRDNFGPAVVPPGKYFVLGDNRDVSADSRYWGFLNREDITGTPFMIFFSWDSRSNKPRWDRIFKLIK